MTLMKTILLLSLLLLAGPAGLRGQSPQPADSLLRARLDTLVKHNLPRGAAAGICIYDLSAGRTLYEHQADKLSRPASTMKVMTAITTLAQPGAMEPFRTELWTTGRVAGDTLRGDLYVVGGFDPEFDTDDLEELIGGLTKRGIRVVDGRIVGDVSMKDSLYWGSGWLWDDAPAPYQPYLSPLMLNKGVLQLSIVPDERGLSALVMGNPSSSYYTIENHTRSHWPAAGPLRVERNWMENGNRISLQGNVRAVEGRSFSLFDSGRMFMHVFVERLLEAGIHCTAVTDSTRTGIEAAYCFGELPTDSVERTRLTVHETPFQAVLDEMLKESDNLNAEAMLCRAGVLASGGKKRVSAKDGLDAMRALIRRVGLNPKHYSLADGCGLSHYDYLSPELLVAMLRYAYSRSDIFSPLYKALPVSGVDGTLKYRMGYGTPAFRQVHAKTGSYTGINALAGYLKTTEGHWVAFAIMTQNVLSGRQARAFQDAVCLEVVKASIRK